MAQIATATLIKSPPITHKGTAKPLIRLKTANAAKQALALDTANKRAIWQKVQSLAIMMVLLWGGGDSIPTDNRRQFIEPQ
jgi:hypothetical protein